MQVERETRMMAMMHKNDQLWPYSQVNTKTTVYFLNRRVKCKHVLLNTEVIARTAAGAERGGKCE